MIKILERINHKTCENTYKKYLEKGNKKEV